MKKTARTWLLLLPCVLLVARPATVEANTWRAFGLGPRAVAMGNAFTAVADDFSAGYYNPAGILSPPGTKFGIGYHYIREDLKAGATEVPSSRDADALYMGGAMPIPFTDEWENRVALGYYFLQPLFYSIDILIPEATQPQFPLLESMGRMQILHLVAAFDFIPGVLIGGGLTISSDLGGALDLKPGVAGFGGVEEVLSSVDQEVHPILSGTAGLLIRPGRFHTSLEDLTIGFTWRDKHFLDLDIPVSVLLSGFVLRLDLTSAFLYTPRQWVLGVSYRWTENLLLACDVSYNEWSDFKVPSLTIDTDIDIPLIVLKKGENESPNFKDTVTPRMGLEYRAYRGAGMDAFLRAGYAYEPSPVPEQRGRSNFMDSDRHAFSWGVGFALKRLFGQELSGRFLSLDIGIAYRYLERRTSRKGSAVPTDNPGSPEITSSGNVWYFTAGFSYGPRLSEPDASSL